MSEYRITYAEIPNPRSDDETHGGVLVHVQPPVQLNSDAVERYLTQSDFEPVDRSGNWAHMDIKDVVVLGSTPEQTTIYASTSKNVDQHRCAERAAELTADLLQFMGATAIIDHPPAPDA